MGQCPSSFVPYQGACVRECPKDNFSFVTDNNQPRCVSKTDSSKKVLLTPVMAVFQEQGKPIPTMESLQQSDSKHYSLFKTEAERVNAELAVILSQIDKQKQTEDAFRALQEAENVRDQSPEAYERARVSYYSLTQGPQWVEQEKERIAKVDVEPELSRYKTTYDTIKSREENQQRTQDIMNSVKEGVLTLKDDFKYTTNLFKDQIETLKSQINIERRGREKPVSDASDFYKWIDALLNLFIIAGLVYAAFVLWRKLRSQPQPTYAPMTVAQ